MIFLTVGTQKFPFNRLIKEVDRCVVENIIKDEIFAQIGESNYIPQHFEYAKYLSKQQFDKMIFKSDIVITHGGVATIMSALKAKKKVIVVPRLSIYGEHVDDHQKEITQAFANVNYIEPCYQINQISSAIENVKATQKSIYVSSRNNIMSTIENFITKIEKKDY